MKDALLSIARTVLTAVAAYLAARGIVAEDASQTIVAGLVAIVSAAYDFFATRKLAANANAAVEAGVNVK